MTDSPRRSSAPGLGARIPVNTYRLQIQPEFGFDAAQGALDYLERLGVTDLYLSPILQATPGSTHCYDVVDHSTINVELGGREAFESLARDAHSRGMGVIVDVVPNHMAVPTPLYLNKALWSVLRDGPDSPYADWFDGTESEDGILMPVLGARIGTVLAAGELSVTRMVVPGFEDEGEVGVLTYFDHVFPLREGSEALPMDRLVQHQHYRLAYWKVADEELNYRRFFDVDTLAAVRVEDPEVFDATHELLLELYRAGHIDGFRIDHPDGLADPRGYMRRLSEATGGAWIIGEKILEADEQLPTDWPVAGTSGYDVSWRVDGLQVDPNGAVELTRLAEELTGEPQSLPAMYDAGKRQVATTSLYAEIHRIATLAAEICLNDIRLRDHTFRSLLSCLTELVLEVDRYRAYVVPGEAAPAESVQVITEAAERALVHLDQDLAETLEVVVDLVLGREVGSAGRRLEDRRSELIVRFQQVTGAVTAKGVEDTAFYRWTVLTSLCEVGGSPASFGVSPDQFHDFAAAHGRAWPATLSLGSTHDSKRSEDVRSRIGVASQFPHEWAHLVRSLAPRFAGIDGAAANLALQVVAGTWDEAGPISAERLERYLTKAVREQKTWTSWTRPDEKGEAALLQAATGLLTDPDAVALYEDWRALTSEAVRASILGTKAVQLTAVGVADTYNGCETTQTFLVDPDNRAPMDVEGLTALLDRAEVKARGTLREEKIALTSAVLSLRARRPQDFVGATASYTPLPASTGHVIAFLRGNGAVTVATRLQRAVAGGIGSHTVVLPDGQWQEVRSGTVYGGGTIALADLLATSPVAVLEKVDE